MHQANYLVLTALLEAHYRKPYPAIARERILQPLKMASTSWGGASVPTQRAAVLHRQGRPTAAGNEDPWPDYGWGHADLQTTVGDMNRFLQALATGKLVAHGDPGRTLAAAETERWRQQFLLHRLGHHRSDSYTRSAMMAAPAFVRGWPTKARWPAATGCSCT